MTSCPFASLHNGLLPEGFCAFELPVPLSTPRSILAIGTGNVLVLERGTNSVVLVVEEEVKAPDNETAAVFVTYTRRTLVSAGSLNHGLALHGGYIYASSDTTVFRWPYTDNETFSDVDGSQPQVVINNINADGQGGAPGGHTTRTLAFDAMGRLYVSVGSYSNVDRDSVRSRIRRFSDLPTTTLPIDFMQGEVFADGVRNEVGLAFDRFGILWGVENGADRLQRTDLGGDITNDNPGEELHRFTEDLAGSHFGYPYCWTEYLLPPEYGLGRGTVWAWPDFLIAGTVTDEMCRSNYTRAELSMQAHSAPLGITFYEWKNSSDIPAECQGSGGAFPQEMDGYAFIGFHGSWNRDIPTGYKVVYVAMNEHGRAVGEPVDLLAHAGSGARWDDGFRPVDVGFDACGRLLVSSDGTRGAGSKLVRIEYHGESNTNTTTVEPTKSPVQGTYVPSVAPLAAPSIVPSAAPSSAPVLSASPSTTPIAVSNVSPNAAPSVAPSETPAVAAPSGTPSVSPSVALLVARSASPSAPTSAAPSMAPSPVSMTVRPTSTPKISPDQPSHSPTAISNTEGVTPIPSQSVTATGMNFFIVLLLCLLLVLLLQK